jgi:hypothetical protein
LNIPDGQRHEPKGASSAPSNSVYSADGAGSGAWQKVKSNNLQGVAGDGGSNNLRPITDGANGFVLRTASAFGTMAVSANTNAFSVTAAADSTLNTNTDYVLFTGTGAPWASENLFGGVTFTTNRLTVPVTGIYKIDLWSTVIGWPSNAAKISIKYRINGGTFSTRHPMAKSPAVATDPGELSGFGHIPLTAGDFLQLYVASTVTGNLTFSDLNTTLSLVIQTA